MNPWMSRIQDAEHPDFINIDLDPSVDDFKNAKLLNVNCNDWIRTSGLFVPNEARYRAALHPVIEPQKYLYSRNNQIMNMDFIKYKAPDFRSFVI